MSSLAPTSNPPDPEVLWKAELKYYSLKRKQMNDDTAFFKKYPEWWGYMTLGRKLLLKMSKSRQFQRFTQFQVDFMLSFLDPHVYKLFVVANRGGAKSWLLAYCTALEASVIPNIEISVLAGSEEQADKVFNYVKEMLTSPLSGAASAVKRATLDEIELYNGSFIYRLAASETSVRGPRGDKLVVDEITRIKMSILTSFFGQAITSFEFKLACGGTPDDPTHMAFQWWCSPPRQGIHHWINADSGFHLFHWNAFDCLVSKGGWIFPETLKAMENLYASRLDYRREILGLWTSQQGSILNLDDIEKATHDFRQKDLPDPSTLDGIIISVDGARHSHYSTVIAVGYVDHRAYVYSAKGWDNISEQVLRKRIMDLVRHYRVICKTHVIIEDAPISTTLIDNVREECVYENVTFSKSRFDTDKNKFVDSVCGYFENGAIRIPQEYLQLINELFMWRWGTNGKPEKGNDDFVDALCHNLHNDNKIYYRSHPIQHAGAKTQVDDTQKAEKAIKYFQAAARNRSTGETMSRFNNMKRGF